jgi:DNA-binding Lrp family transcriptional regulator
MTVSARYEPRQQERAGTGRIYTARITQAWAKRGASPLAAVSPGAQALWMHLANTYQSHTWVKRDDGSYAATAYPSQHTLARALGVSEETIRRRTRELAAAGLLQVLRVAIDGTKRKRCYYTLLAPMKHSAMPARRKRAAQAPRGCVKQRMENPAPTRSQVRELQLVDDHRAAVEETERTRGKAEADMMRATLDTIRRKQRQAGARPQHTAVSLADAALLVGDTLDTERRGVPIRISTDAAPMVAEACRRMPGFTPQAAAALVRHCGLDAFAEALDGVRHMGARKRESVGNIIGWFTRATQRIAQKGYTDASA